MNEKQVPLAHVLREFPSGQSPHFSLKIQDIQNSTTRTPLLKEARFVELLKQGMVIEVAPQTATIGHHLSLCIRVEFKACSCTIPLKASITSEESSLKSQILTLQLIQIEQPEWYALQELLQQNKVA